ncbi:GroES-like zinc-binding alcohol dehydrogenase family protein [Gossypium australe]|uniref:GroES-like zinc-binding alcohol dehydrogenase family protein n=1 Tax=Gossypium australe TaxID=47621 RepID=A0A5B6UYP5_9ROSI|nr:GroES-like zinc-binding alcohol dehydrogenase family protein [Gossypium australe]
MVMQPAPITRKPRSWKDCLVGTGLKDGELSETSRSLNDGGDFEFSEVDIVRSSVNEVPSIKLSEQVNQILIKYMAHTVVIKLLGQIIGYLALHNKPSQPFRLMDVENSYFLAKFQNLKDFDKVLCQGPWIVYRLHLTVQPWTHSTTLSKNGHGLDSAPGSTWAYVQKKGFVGNRRTIGEVAKLDFNTDNKVRGRFTRMAVYVNLEKALNLK